MFQYTANLFNKLLASSTDPGGLTVNQILNCAKRTYTTLAGAGKWISDPTVAASFKASKASTNPSALSASTGTLKWFNCDEPSHA